MDERCRSLRCSEAHIRSSAHIFGRVPEVAVPEGV